MMQCYPIYIKDIIKYCITRDFISDFEVIWCSKLGKWVLRFEVQLVQVFATCRI